MATGRRPIPRGTVDSPARMWWAQSHRLVSTGTHGLPPGRTLGEGFEEAAGLGDGGAAAGGLGQEGGEGRGEGTGELGRAGPFAEDGRGGGLPSRQGGLPPLLSGPPPRAAERSLTLDCKEQDGPQGPEVGWGAGGVASDLFGGEEGGRAPVGAGGGAEGGQADAAEAGVAVGGIRTFPGRRSRWPDRRRGLPGGCRAAPGPCWPPGRPGGGRPWR